MESSDSIFIANHPTEPDYLIVTAICDEEYEASDPDKVAESHEIEPEPVHLALSRPEAMRLLHLLNAWAQGKVRTYDEWYAEWSEESGTMILDHDGFRKEGITRDITLFTLEEFVERAMKCTQGPKFDGAA
jgi:hypothetical protein